MKPILGEIILQIKTDSFSATYQRQNFYSQDLVYISVTCEVTSVRSSVGFVISARVSRMKFSDFKQFVGMHFFGESLYKDVFFLCPQKLPYWIKRLCSVWRTTFWERLTAVKMYFLIYQRPFTPLTMWSWWKDSSLTLVSQNWRWTGSDHTLKTATPRYGVPQGSIFGPLLFTLYIAPLQDVIARHNLNSFFYADNTQLYIAIAPANQAPSLTALQTCIEDVMQWNAQNMLRSNVEKKEVILFTSGFTKTPNTEKLFFDSAVTELTEKVRDLGVILDKNLILTYHINETCRKATNAIRSIGRIRKYLTNKNLKLLVNALVISRLDYCNSILYGLPKRELDKLQRVQNTAARLITGTKQYDRIKPALQKQHWLPVESRIIFKVIIITFKILDGLSPTYLSSLLQE